MRKTLTIDKETGHGQYLGCGHEPGQFTMLDGGVATSVSYNMENFWDSCVQRYKDLAGPNVRIKEVPTPFLVEDSEKGLLALLARQGTLPSALRLHTRSLRLSTRIWMS